MNLRIAFIGCGNIARQHLRHVAKHIPPESMALCDRDETRLRDYAENTGIGYTYTNLERMLEDFKPEVVHILTPPATHKAIALQCLQAGSHVLIEKPMCLSVDEARQIREVAAAKKRLVCVDYMRLFDPAIMRVRSIIDSGKVGKLVNIAGCMGHDILELERQGLDVRWVRQLRGGIFFDIMPHLVYLVQEFLDEVNCSKSFSHYDSNGRLAELVSVFTGSAGHATLRMTLNVFPLENYIEFACTKGVIKVDFRNFITTVRRRYGMPNAVERIVGNLSVAFQIIGGTVASMVRFLAGWLDPYAGLGVIIEKLYQAVLTDGASPVPAEQAEKVTELMQSVFAEIPHIAVPEADEFRQGQLSEADILITGGTGFIGQSLVARFAARGKRVRVLTHRKVEDADALFAHQSVEVLTGDVYNYADCVRACTGVKTVYHLAAAMKGDWYYHLDTTISGTRNMLKAAKEHRIDHFIYVSTVNVYDAKNYPDGQIIDESFPYEDQPAKRGHYSHAKLKAEQLVRRFQTDEKFPITIVRPGLVYGKGKDPFNRDIGIRLGKKLVIVMGNGMKKIPFIYRENLIDALVMIVDAKAQTTGQIFNVVDDVSPTQRYFIQVYKSITQTNFLTLYVPFGVFYAAFWCLEKTLKYVLRKEVNICYKLKSVRKSVKHSADKFAESCQWSSEVTFENAMRYILEKQVNE